MSPQFEAAYLRYAVLTFDKQLNMANIIGNRSWSFSMDAPKITFDAQGPSDSPLEFEAQVLGSAAEKLRTWLWSWDNSHVPDALSQASILLRERGGLSEFATAEFPIEFDSADDHRVAMTSAGVLAHLAGCDAYYRGPYEGGAAFFVLRDPRLQLPSPDAIHISTLFPQAISALPLSNHRTAFMGYLEECGIAAQVDGDQVHVVIGNSDLTARFDTLDRLADMQLHARP